MIIVILVMMSQERIEKAIMTPTEDVLGNIGLIVITTKAIEKDSECEKDRIVDKRKSPVEKTGLFLITNDYTNNMSQNSQKPFVIRCLHCRWGKSSNGTKGDLGDLVEIKNNCSKCGKSRKFRCPKCGRPATMRRLRGNT